MALRPKLNFVVLDPGSGKARPGAFVTMYASNTLEKAEWKLPEISSISA